MPEGCSRSRSVVGSIDPILLHVLALLHRQCVFPLCALGKKEVSTLGVNRLATVFLLTVYCPAPHSLARATGLVNRLRSINAMSVNAQVEARSNRHRCVNATWIAEVSNASASGIGVTSTHGEYAGA